MNIFQRSSKGSRLTPTSSVDNLPERLTRYQASLWTRWQALSERDQLALGVLLLFLILFVGGYGGYSVHQAAKESKMDYQMQVADYFWLRAQAGNIDVNAINASTDGATVPPATSVNTLLSSAGIDNAQVVAVGNGVQLSFTHPSQAVVSAALGKLTQQGWQFNQLTMQQDATTKQIEVQASIAS